MSGNEIALTLIIVVTISAVLFAFAISLWGKVRCKKP
jgi:hypothetical protein